MPEKGEMAGKKATTFTTNSIADFDFIDPKRGLIVGFDSNAFAFFLFNHPNKILIRQEKHFSTITFNFFLFCFQNIHSFN